MLRSELIQGAKEILTTFGIAKIPKIFEELLRPSDSKDYDSRVDLLACFREYTICFEKFSLSAKRIIDVFDLGLLQKIEFWESLFRTDQKKETTLSPFPIRRQLLDLINACYYTKNHLGKIILLLERNIDNLLKNRDKQIKNENDIIQIIVIEDKQFSTPSRVIMAIESIETLYKTCADLLRNESNTISIISCDSGSDKAFDFLGLAKVIECLKEIILSLWDKVVFYRERKFQSHLELFAQSLPILERIDDMANKNQIDPEQATFFKRNITEGMKKFLKAGVVIPEMRENSTFSPRELMAPEPKLLTSPKKKKVSNKERAKKTKRSKKASKKSEIE